jgi:cytochrome c
MSRSYPLHIATAISVALAALLLVRLHNASSEPLVPDSASAGHKLAEAWCTACHVIEGTTAGASSAAPDFVAIANQPGTTALSVKVFLQTSHRSMPNLVLTPAQTGDLADYIISLKRN